VIRYYACVMALVATLAGAAFMVGVGIAATVEAGRGWMVAAWAVFAVFAGGYAWGYVEGWHDDDQDGS
jgi:hypothetical protein